jgi:hypothetical protein
LRSRASPCGAERASALVGARTARRDERASQTTSPNARGTRGGGRAQGSSRAPYRVEAGVSAEAAIASASDDLRAFRTTMSSRSLASAIAEVWTAMPVTLANRPQRSSGAPVVRRLPLSRAATSDTTTQTPALEGFSTVWLTTGQDSQRPMLCSNAPMSPHASAHAAALVFFRCGRPLRLMIAALPLRSAIVWVGPPLLLRLAILGATPTMSVAWLNPAQEVGHPIAAGPSGETRLWCRRRPGRPRRAPRGRSRENADGRAIDLAQLPTAQRASPGSGYPPPSAANRASESSTSARTSAR